MISVKVETFLHILRVHINFIIIHLPQFITPKHDFLLYTIIFFFVVVIKPSLFWHTIVEVAIEALRQLSIHALLLHSNLLILKCSMNFALLYACC